ncbi:MAG: hypothetical protein ABSH50_18830 [Bryobacteraceae bacterium]
MLGTLGMAGVIAHSAGLLLLCSLAAAFLLLTPLAIVIPYGGSLHPQGQLLIICLCLISMAGGLLALWGAVCKNKNVGNAIWMTLAVVSIATASWNLEWFLVERHSSNVPVAMLSVFWAFVYVVAYCLAFRTTKSVLATDEHR